jgi:hypothetical protein
MRSEGHARGSVLLRVGAHGTATSGRRTKGHRSHPMLFFDLPRQAVDMVTEIKGCCFIGNRLKGEYATGSAVDASGYQEAEDVLIVLENCTVMGNKIDADDGGGAVRFDTPSTDAPGMAKILRALITGSNPLKSPTRTYRLIRPDCSTQHPPPAPATRPLNPAVLQRLLTKRPLNRKKVHVVKILPPPWGLPGATWRLTPSHQLIGALGPPAVTSAAAIWPTASRPTAFSRGCRCRIRLATCIWGLSRGTGSVVRPSYRPRPQCPSPTEKKRLNLEAWLKGSTRTVSRKAGQDGH